MLDWPLLLNLTVSLTLSLPIGIWLLRRETRRINKTLTALESGLLNFKDNDFSISLAIEQPRELADLARLYNEVGETMRQERQHIYQRELLLDTVLQNSPLAMLLVDGQRRIEYANHFSRHLLNEGRPVRGMLLEDALGAAHPAIKEAFGSGRDSLFTLEVDGENQTYHLSRGYFTLNTQSHDLFLLKQMTREMNRREVEIWKKVIRLISHELNNSLAPITSLAHSGKILSARVAGPDPAATTGKERLNNVFDTIAERAQHLADFISGYARFARLPLPNPSRIEWVALVNSLQLQAAFELAGEYPASPGWADQAQLEQVLINLLKNAKEAGSPEQDIRFSIREVKGGHQLIVEDRGSGMPDAVLSQAMLPFYSTKAQGTGLGLALCHEIIDAHEGRIGLRNRPEGGLQVSIFLPDQATAGD